MCLKDSQIQYFTSHIIKLRFFALFSPHVWFQMCEIVWINGTKRKLAFHTSLSVKSTIRSLHDAFLNFKFLSICVLLFHAWREEWREKTFCSPVAFLSIFHLGWFKFFLFFLLELQKMQNRKICKTGEKRKKNERKMMKITTFDGNEKWEKERVSEMMKRNFFIWGWFRYNVT